MRKKKPIVADAGGVVATLARAHLETIAGGLSNVQKSDSEVRLNTVRNVRS